MRQSCSTNNEELLGKDVDTRARAPTSGGQYHWISMLAPTSCRKFTSYTMGRYRALPWFVKIILGRHTDVGEQDGSSFVDGKQSLLVVHTSAVT